MKLDELLKAERQKNEMTETQKHKKRERRNDKKTEREKKRMEKRQNEKETERQKKDQNFNKKIQNFQKIKTFKREIKRSSKILNIEIQYSELDKEIITLLHAEG